jgi:hypothetical protein
LILLIVLGMLTLFSLLAISYIVVSGQSRTANFGMARQDFHGTAAPKLLDEAARQLLRGSLDHNSIMWRQGLLGDLYGSGNLDNAGLPLPISDGSVVRFARTPATVNTPNAPAIFKQTFLKIPLANTAPSLPVHHDVWNGRIVTFGGGPLSGESFRIVRYCGDMQGGSANAFDQALEYSIVIDLTHVKSRIITVGTTSQSVDQWIASSSTSNGAILCYDSVANALQSPYPLLINGAPLNASGSGLGVDGVWAAATPTPPTPQLAQSAPTIAALAHAPPALSQYPTGFGNFPTAFLQNFAYTQRANVAFQPAGDLDEPYDAADYNDFHVAFRHSGAASGADIIPSFHRPSVINFIYEQIKLSKGGSIASFTPQELFATIDLLQRASGRPLSFRVQNVPTQYRLPPPPNSTNRYPHIEQNPQFTGGNFPAFSPLPIRTPQLDIDWQAWASDTQQQVKFENWVNWLREGPWDVDADSDGLEDSNWVDLNFPLMTSPEGKLLKLLTAYYVEDLGGRLNINTSGNLAQANRSTNTFSGDTSRFVDALALPQGPGYGTAEISLRHLFTSDLAYIRFLAERYGATVQTPPAQLVNFRPGTNGNDPASILRERHRRPQYNPLSLPGLPTSVFGEVGLTLDLFGNPIRYQVAEPDQNLDDPYEARLLNGESHHDLPITLAEWERLARQQDWDRSSMPQRLERLMGAVTPDVMRGITPRSNSTLAPMFSGTYLTGATLPAPPVRRVGSFLELVEALAQQRFSASSIYFTNQQLKMLFPVEFSHNIKLDLNRPLGNGLDDNSNGLVDEPEEVGAGQLAEYVSAPLPAISDQYDRDKDREGDTGGLFDPYAAIPNYFIPAVNGSRGRQLLARHLYCLAQLILPDDYVLPNQEPTTYSGLTTLAKREVRARVLAQWAVNVVDFRDADITMTRFPYDPDPFGVTNSNVAKWQPDTNHVVWGCEPTDLLLTETLAFHDTRECPKEVCSSSYFTHAAAIPTQLLSLIRPRSPRLGVTTG